jgi:hypothetical protein
MNWRFLFIGLLSSSLHAQVPGDDRHESLRDGYTMDMVALGFKPRNGQHESLRDGSFYQLRQGDVLVASRWSVRSREIYTFSLMPLV